MNVTLPRNLAYGAIALAIVGAIAGSLPALPAIVGSALLVASVALVVAAAYVAPKATAASQLEEPSFGREMGLHFTSLALLVVFLLLGLTELLAIPAALGQLQVFGSFALGFLTFYPALLGALTAALALALVLALLGLGLTLSRLRGQGRRK